MSIDRPVVQKCMGPGLSTKCMEGLCPPPESKTYENKGMQVPDVIDRNSQSFLVVARSSCAGFEIGNALLTSLSKQIAVLTGAFFALSDFALHLLTQARVRGVISASIGNRFHNFAPRRWLASEAAVSSG